MANYAQVPACSVPAGLVDGLRVGLQIIGPRYADARVLQFAAEVERMLGPARVRYGRSEPRSAFMHLLLINPNISASVSALIEAEARRSASDGTTMIYGTLRRGLYRNALRGADRRLRRCATCGRASPARRRGNRRCLGDPGLAGLREALPCPVTGLSEAALASACLMGQRFSIVAVSFAHPRLVPRDRRTQRPHWAAGQHPRAGRTARRHGSVQGDQRTALLAAAERCVRDDGADVIILAGAPLAGLAQRWAMN